MSNLRLVEIKVLDNTNLQATFTEELYPFLNTGNVAIQSMVEGVPDPQVLEISVDGPELTITTLPFTPYALYQITFQSDSVRFKSKNGTAFLLEDGTTNVSSFLGQEDPADPIRDNLIGYLKGNIYDYDNGTIVRDLINLQSKNLSRALYDIRQLKNDNYLSFDVIDELKTRGAGPYDRLIEEGAYEILRVGKTPTGTTTDGTLTFDSFPSSPVSLQTISITSEQLTAGTSIGNFNGLVLTVKNHPVTKLTNLIIAYQNGSTANYDISTFGYRILDSKYDQDFASTLSTLKDNQFQLNDTLLDGSFVLPKAGDTLIVSYEYKRLGRIIDENSVVVSQLLKAIREVTPPILTHFTLQHAPIVDINGLLSTSAGVSFLDPEANPPFSTTHPAFTKEIPFRFDSLPARKGEYSINYQTGQVYVYGAVSNDGTGNFPPTATYNYQQDFSSRLDYTYDPDSSDLVANPLRELATKTAFISFNYEDTLIPGTDFNAQIHQEVLDERVQNRLLSSISVRPLNSPITNVFRVFNETSGEVYKLQRWSDNTIYFSSKIPPRINGIVRERVAFTDVLDELLITKTETTNISSVRVFTIDLNNPRIMGSSEDVIGASFNTSAQFSRTDIFQQEIYYDSQILTASQNIDRLSVGQYMIDYQNGICYVGVSHGQNYDLGTINYKNSIISPANSHVIGVTELYNSISTMDGINKRISYLSFGEASVVPSSFDVADERFLNKDTSQPYIVSAGTITVTDDIKTVRGIFDYYDLVHNSSPVNFADNATVSANIITLDSSGIEIKETLVIHSGLVLDTTFFSPGIEIASVTEIIRTSDYAQLSVSSFSASQIILGATNSPVVGEAVLVTYRVALNGGSTPIVDYNRGDYFIDYDYLADEILISYEYGDNCIDFRQSSAVDTGAQYYVSYKVGALRDALLKNFGSLVDISILNNFDTSLPRENYRDALTAALQSFTKGPTIPSMKALVSNITHIDPEIIEAAFQNWSLGISYLYPNAIDYTGTPQLLSAKYDNGVLADQGQTITMPVASNLRLEEGTLEMWVIPEWDGLDNDSDLTFTIQKDGYTLPANKIWIGSDSHHPTYNLSNQFTLNKTDEQSPTGLPSAIYTQTGFFIFYDSTNKVWQVLAKDQVTNTSSIYSGNITCSGEFYNVKWIPGLNEIDDVLKTAPKKIYFEFHLDGYDYLSPDGYVDGYSLIDGYSPQDGYSSGYSFDGIDFMADDEHYLFDFGKTNDSNRFSIYKDGQGYLNFRVLDNKTFGRINQYKVSSDISGWKAGEKHHIATSWKLNTSNRRDEMHLFIDGAEIPNILRYGGRPIASSTDRFRTVKPEIIAGTVPKNTITNNDLTTTSGSNVVSSATIDFGANGILAGDTIQIKETGFTTYTIVTVSGKSLTLNTTMPATLQDARFSVNPYSVIVASEIDLSSNITIGIIHNGTETEIPGLRALVPTYEISQNMLNQNILTLLGNAQAGDQIVIRTLGLNHRRCRDRKFIWGNTTNIIKTQLPPPINLDEVKIFTVILPLYPIGPNNASLIGNAYVASSIQTAQPSNATEGRTLAVQMNSNNVNFTTPATVQIFGTTAAGPVSETVSFTTAGTQNTINKFKTISSVTITAVPLNPSKSTVAVEIKEAYQITYSEGNSIYPVIRYSYKTQTGSHLQGTGSSTVTDASGYFPASVVDQKLVIYSPGSVAGTYSITDRTDNTNIIVSPTPPASFSSGSYDIFNTTIGRSGFQNGFFTLEQAGQTNVPFTLSQGYYDFDYSVYLEVPFAPIGNEQIFIGSDRNGNNQAKAILDELVILSTQLTDVRTGEVIPSTQESITTDFHRLKPFKANSDILTLIHFDNLPFTNEADFWVTANQAFLQSDNSVNDNFGKCLVITDKPLEIDNAGLLSTSSEGTIEFWVSPRYDTFNDPNFRFYFDASGSVVEEETSITNGTVKVSGKISSVLSVRLMTDKQNTGTNYAVGGSILADFQTIQLGQALPYQETPVKVNYIPSGLKGDRISIYKDMEGFIVFNVTANGEDFQVRQPVFWSRDTWHRIRATFKFNRIDNLDEIRLFVDGEERGAIRFGTGLIFGSGIVYGQGFAGVDNSILVDDINFKDPINQFYIGSDYLKAHGAQARIDNLRISNTSRIPLYVAGQPKDINYSSNNDTVLPVITDAFTTYLLDFDTLSAKNDNFSLLVNDKFGIFNFTLNVIDSFGIVSGNPKIKQILETLVSVLKPAQSKATINYF